jgi:hypothetical protein
MSKITKLLWTLHLVIMFRSFEDRRQYAPLKRRSTTARLNGDVSQNALIFRFVAVRTWNLTFLFLHVLNNVTIWMSRGWFVLWCGLVCTTALKCYLKLGVYTKSVWLRIVASNFSFEGSTALASLCVRLDGTTHMTPEQRRAVQVSLLAASHQWSEPWKQRRQSFTHTLLFHFQALCLYVASAGLRHSEAPRHNNFGPPCRL